MVRIGPLSLEHQRRLRQMRRRAIGRVALRAQMVLLSARGYTVPQLAEIFEVGEDVVREWLHRFQERGPDGLEDRPRPGRPPQDRLAGTSSMPRCRTVRATAAWSRPAGRWGC